MPSPVETPTLCVGEKRTLTFVTGLDFTNSNNNTALFTNLTTGNNLTFNNASLTLVDTVTGVVTLSFNASEAGEYVGQITASNNNATTGTTLKSPLFSLKVQTGL